MKARVAVLLTAGALMAGAVLMYTASISPDCQVSSAPRREGSLQLVGAGELLPSGSVGQGRREEIGAALGLGGPFGRLAAGRFYRGSDEVPTVVPNGTSVVLVDSATSGPGGSSLIAVEMPDGTPAWGRQLQQAPVAGGLIGDQWVAVFGGETPAAAGYDALTGAEERCVTLPRQFAGGRDTKFLVDQAADDVVVLSASPGRVPNLSRIGWDTTDPGWEVPLVPGPVGAVEVSGEAVIVSRLSHDPVRQTEDAVGGGLTSPSIKAFSVADGTALWTYPGQESFASEPASLLGSDAASGLSVVLVTRAVKNATGATPSSVRSRLVALDPRGAPVWSQALGGGYVDGSIWGDAVIVRGPRADGEAELTAYSLKDGAERWVLSTADLRQPDGVSKRFGEGWELGGHYVLTAPGGLLVIDPASGRSRLIRSQLPVTDIQLIGDFVLMTTGRALLVFEFDAAWKPES